MTDTGQQASILQQMALNQAPQSALPALQRSQYLAQALQNMQASAAQGIKTPTALWSSLLADGLLQYSKQKNDAQLLQAINGARTGQVNAANSEMGLPPTAAPAQASPAPSGGLLGGIGNAVSGGMGMVAHLLGGGSPQTAPPVNGAPPAPLPPGPAPAGPAGAPAPGGLGPMPPPSAPPMQGALPPTPQSAPPAMPASAAPPLQAPQIDPNTDAVVRMTYGEARGEPPVGQQAVAAVALNRARATGLPVSAIVSAPSQFPGLAQGAHLSPSDPAYQQILKNIQPALQGYDPTGGADHYYAPKGMPGGIPPKWAVGQSGTTIGNHVFMSLGPTQGAPQAVAQNPGSFQVAGPIPQGGNGQPPSPASPPQVAGGPPPPVVTPSTGGGVAPAQIPTGPGPTPQELHDYNMYRGLGTPYGMQQAQSIADAVGQRARTPADPTKPVWNAQTGSYGPAPGVGQVLQPNLSTPDSQVTYDPSTGKYEALRTTGGVQDGMGWDAATGKFDRDVGLRHQMVGAPAQGTLLDVGPDGKATVTQGPQTTPDAVRSATNDYINGNAYKGALASVNAANSVQRILASAKVNNGMVDMAAMDNVLKAETGLSAKQGGMTMLLEHGGLPNQVQGAIGNLFGQGFVPASQLRDAVNIVRQYATTDAHQAQTELQQRDAQMRKLSGGAYGMDGISAPQLDPMPNVPWLGAPAGGAADPQASIMAARSAIARGAPRDAVIGRLQAAGINPAGL